MRDLYNNVEVRRALSPAAAVTDNTAQVSEIIDMRGFQSLAFCVLTGALADLDATFAVLIEHGDQSDLSDAAAVPDTELNGTEALIGFDFADDDQARKIGYIGSKRYVRMTITPANNTGNAFLAAVAILAKATDSPTGAQAD